MTTSIVANDRASAADRLALREARFEVVDLGVGALPVGVRAEPFHALDEHAANTTNATHALPTRRVFILANVPAYDARRRRPRPRTSPR